MKRFKIILAAVAITTAFTVTLAGTRKTTVVTTAVTFGDPVPDCVFFPPCDAAPPTQSGGGGN
jgi:hypothetical protein